MLTLWNVDDFTSPEVYAALVAVVGAVVGAVLLYLSTIWVARKNLFVATITSERAKWRDDLRVATVNLFPAVRAALITPNAMTLGNYDRCRIAIRRCWNCYEKCILVMRTTKGRGFFVTGQ